MVVYKVKDNKIIGISNKDNVYQLQENEYSSNTWYLKPFFNGTGVVESITQQEIDDRVELEADILAQEIISKRERDGDEFYAKVATMVKRRYDDGSLTAAQYKNIRTVLKDVLQPLRWGDWDLAQDNINAINRPSGQMGVLYDYLKTNIDNYITINY